MKCPSCDATIPDHSRFCTNCGIVFKRSMTEGAPPLNVKTPVDIAAVEIYFEGEIQANSHGDKVNRRMTVAFQLVDEDQRSTACEGLVTVKVEFWQGYDSSSAYGTHFVSVGKGSFSKELKVGISDFHRSWDGKIWCKYLHPQLFSINVGYVVGCKVEVWFRPADSRQKLYKADTHSLSAT